MNLNTWGDFQICISVPLRKTNKDRMFAKSFIDQMFEVCKLFGPNVVLSMSHNDKARILLGLAATNPSTIADTYGV